MYTREINSLQHPLVKHCVRLRKERGYRYEEKRVIVCGQKLTREMPQIERLYRLRGSSFPNLGKEVIEVSEEVLKKISGHKAPDQVAAEVTLPAFSDLSSCEKLLLIDGVSDPGNLGTLLRSALGLGFDGCFLIEGSVDPFNDKALNASKGASFHLPLRMGMWKQAKECLRGRAAYRGDLGGADLGKMRFKPPFALILGNEGSGPSDEAKEVSEAVSIPMTQGVDSLNVAIAGGILMYTMVHAHE